MRKVLMGSAALLCVFGGGYADLSRFSVSPAFRPPAFPCLHPSRDTCTSCCWPRARLMIRSSSLFAFPWMLFRQDGPT